MDSVVAPTCTTCAEPLAICICSLAQRECADLELCQRQALEKVREEARAKHVAALPRLKNRAGQLGYSSSDVDQTLQWIREEAPIIIHVDLAKIGAGLAKDTHYRNQFEVESCDPLEDCLRAESESRLFGSSYEGVSASARCKYGVLNVTNDMQGVEASRQDTNSYLLLRGVRDRTTFSAKSSVGLDRVHLGTAEYYAHILEEYGNSELHAVLKVGTKRSFTCDSCSMLTCKEAQIHGEVRLADHVELIMVTPSLRTWSDRTVLENLSTRCQAPFIWMEDAESSGVPGKPFFSIREPKTAVPPAFLSSTPALPVSEALPVVEATPSVSCTDPAVDDLERAIKESSELAKEEELFQEALSKALEASLCTVPTETYPSFGEGGTTEANSTIDSIAHRPAVHEYVLKAALGQDVRRLKLSWTKLASAGDIYNVICKTLQVGFPATFAAADPATVCFKYDDDDGDICTLAESTVDDFLSMARGNVLRKLHIFREELACHSIVAMTGLSSANLPEAHLELTDRIQDVSPLAAEQPQVFSLETPPASPRKPIRNDSNRSIKSIDGEHSSWTMVVSADVNSD